MNKNIKKLEKLIKIGEDIISYQCNSESVEFETWQTQVLIILNELFSNESIQYERFKSRNFSPSYFTENEFENDANAFFACKKGVQVTIGELETYRQQFIDDEEISANVADTSENKKVLESKKIFIVHGRSDSIKYEIARFLEKIGFEIVILHEQMNSGRTIIEKLERNNDLFSVIVLMTMDDVGMINNGKDLLPRARQNVIFETGYFCGLIGRERVIIIKEDIEVPSDLSGLLYIDMKDWKLGVLRELKHLGYDSKIADLI